MYLTTTFILVFLRYTVIVKFSSSRKPLGVSHSYSTEGRRLDLQYLLLVHVKALNRTTKTVTLSTNFTFHVAVYYFCTNCDIGLKLRLKWNSALPSVEWLWSAWLMQAENIHRPYRNTTIKLYSHEISRLHHGLEWNILVTLVYSTPDCGVTYT